MPSLPVGPSRRDFIRLVATGSAALAGGNLLWSQAGPAPKEKLGVALLGLGKYSAGQLGPALKETKHCQLTGVITGVREKGEKWAMDYGFPRENIYSYETMDKIANNPAIDIVYVVTPPGLHREFVERVAKAGKHVITEKPMATSVEDCQAMIDICKARKVRLSVGYRLHFDLYHRELVRLARSKEFGAFTKLTGKRAFVMQKHAWRIEKKLGGGGPIMDLGIYLIQGACMATQETPVSVLAREEPKKKPDLFNEVEESMRWSMNFPGGAVADFFTSFNDNGDQFRAEAPRGWFELTEHAFTYRGMKGATSKGPMTFEAINQQAAQMDDFAECVKTGRETPVPGEMGLRDIRITTAIYESARTGKVVNV